jgi:glycosyltransferase involved in cell wall biosynthesis
MYLISHPTGNQNLRHTALALAEAGVLDELWTGLASEKLGPLLRLLPGGLRREALRRSFPAELTRHLRLRPWRELTRLAAPRLRLGHLTRGAGWASVDAVYADLDRRMARRVGERRGLRAVYAYEDGAAATFAAAGRLGLRRVYDLPIAYWRAWAAIRAEERERRPDWAATLQGDQDPPAKLQRKDDELGRCDAIVVASSFTRDSLRQYPGALPPISVVPYGAPGVEVVRDAWSTTGKLRVLYVGALTQRKGIAELFQAVASLGDLVELTVIGRPPAADCPALAAALARARHLPSLPHAEVLGEMRRHDVFVFPSLFEGFGLVLTEAMSQGLPIIATSHTAAPDLIRDGVEGFVVPVRDAPAIAQRLEILARDRARLAAMGAAAQAAAAARTWSDFRRDLRAALGL